MRFNLGNREAGATRFSPMSLPLYFDGGAVQLKVMCIGHLTVLNPTRAWRGYSLTVSVKGSKDKNTE